MSTRKCLQRFLAAASATVLLLSAGATVVSASPLTYTPDAAHNTVALEGIIPVKQFMGVDLPKGSVEFGGDTLSVNIVPNWNFDRVAMLQGPIIRTNVVTTDRQATVTGIVLFTQGNWYDKYWTPGAQETVIGSSGLSATGRITELTLDTLIVTPNGGGTPVQFALADVKEVHSPRAYSFSVPALAATAITAAVGWTADVQTVGFTSTTSTAAVSSTLAFVRRDPLLITDDRAEGDWSNKKMLTIGTLLSVAQIAQFAPVLATAVLSHRTNLTIIRDAFAANKASLSPNAAPLINGNTYSFPGFANH